ncbi:tyrosine-protein phosphatase non-receptor type 20 isoform X1 [Aethina tumida]|uniref:tyrosine-protein phosphatase non-receptor type 20 isoform X1 n=1 Tax=Aethina tumida TaxID=116153 RepID=UPI00096AF8E8|nr:tyrosine-protein phosphatase non-receptor type 20 isoform X1 [Aethina tumida]XP_049826199.1 tyrosine-protein phosphatase non-receptor type 20 isoform X1 [Aethina tumida]
MSKVVKKYLYRNILAKTNNPTEIEMEFDDLELKEFMEETSVGQLESNRKKNRYQNIIPYDYTIVKLDVDDESSDYINASYIKGFSGDREYIAAQAPLRNTVEDFWKMIIQNHVKIIVMITKLVESNKQKCFKYYPCPSKTLKFGDITVRTLYQLNFENHCVREIQLKDQNDRQYSVTQIQYQNWPDFSIPVNKYEMINFCREVRKRQGNRKNLMVVHCSAGVGRTGTFIALDIIRKKIKRRQKFDIMEIVTELRRQRMKMVQSQLQYEFLYGCAVALINR